jgi:hypothetical protein
MAGYNIAIDNSPEHRALVRQFWAENNPKWPQDKLKWFYRDNPCGPAWCALARKADDPKVIGVLAVFPRKVYAAGREVMAGITGDFAVHQSHRVLGPALMLQRAAVSLCTQGKLDFLYGYPNKNSHPVQQRVGFTILGDSQRLVRVLRTKEHLASRLKSSVLGGLVAAPVDLILKLAAPESKLRGSGNFEFEILSEPDSEFDRLWENSAPWRQKLVVGERTAEFLKWRFTDCPYRDYRFFLARRKRPSRTLGYIAYSVENGITTVADIFSNDGSEDMSDLIAAFLRYQWQERTRLIEVTCFGGVARLQNLEQHRFKVRNEGDSHLTYISDRLADIPELQEKKQSFFSPADNDV